MSVRNRDDALQAPPPLTTDEAVYFLVDAIKDPIHPRWCGPCMMIYVLWLDRFNDKEALFNRDHAFGSAIISFLSVQRSAEDLDTLNSRWGECLCPPADIHCNDIASTLHHIANRMVPVIVKQLPKLVKSCSDFNNGRFEHRIDFLGVVIARLVEFLKGRLSKMKPFSIAKGRHPEVWPASPNNLVPHGPETTIESFVTLSRFTHSACVFSLTDALLRICGPALIAAVVSSQSAPSYLAEHGLQICADVSNEPLDPRGKLDVMAAARFVGQLRYLGNFIFGLHRCTPLLRLDFHSGHAQNTFTFVSQAISIMESPIIPLDYENDIKAAKTVLGEYGSVLYAELSEEIGVPRTNVHPTILLALDHIFQDISPAVFAHKMIRGAKLEQYCFAPGCLESAQSSGKVYQRCGGCRVVAYSSKECQKRAWTDERLAHKTICKKIRKVADAYGAHLQRDQDEAALEQVMREVNIEDSTLREVGSWLAEVCMVLHKDGELLAPIPKDSMSHQSDPPFPEGMSDYMEEWGRTQTYYVPVKKN